MFFQADLAVVIGILKGVIISIIIFIIGIFLMRWYARKKEKSLTREIHIEKITQVWDKSLKTAVIVNLIWLVIDILIIILFNFLYTDQIFIDLINVLINIFAGTIIVMRIYKLILRESFLFAAIVQLILFIFTLILSFLITLLLGFFSAGLHEILIYIIVAGLPMTLLLTALGLFSGFVLGISLALMRVYGGKELGWLASGYEKIFRSIPLLVLIYIFAYGTPGLFWFIDDPLQRPIAGVGFALALRSGAYQSQIFRGAILSVNPSQMDAARAVGMNQFQAFRHIVMPQALRLAVPSWSNEYAVVIKDSSFAYAVGVIEMTRAAYYVSINIPELWIISLLLVTILYFLFTYPVTNLFGERQTKKLKELGMGGG